MIHRSRLHSKASHLGFRCAHSALALAAVVSMIALSACSGGGSGGTSSSAIDGLPIADQMSVVTPNSGVGSGAQTSPDTASGGCVFTPDAGFNQDVTHTNVYDSSMEKLQTVNMILCLLGQTRFADLVNRGLYKALIDEKKCDQGKDSGASGSSQGQSSGSDASVPAIFIVNSGRAGNQAAEIVKVWVLEDVGNGQSSVPGAIWIKMTVTQRATPQNPFGVFVMNFAGVPDGGTIADAVMKGTLKTLDESEGTIGFSFYEEEGDLNAVPAPGEHAEKTQVNVNMLADQTSGQAHIVRQERENDGQGDSGILTSDYKIAFDPADVLRQKGNGTPACLSRTVFDTHVWNYNLYYADGANAGQRVDLNSNFGFTTQSGDYGSIGYYGMWLPEGVTVNNGDTVTKNVYGSNAHPTFTVVKAPGKLIKNTKHTLALDQLTGTDFTWWDFGPGGQQQGPPLQYKVRYQGGYFVKVAVWDDQNHGFTDLQTPIVIDTSVTGYLGMWSDSLGGSVSFVNGNEFITYWSQTFVNGADSVFAGTDSVDLYGYVNCLKSSITLQEAVGGLVFEPVPQNTQTPAYHYVFNKSDLTLYFDQDGSGMHLDPAGLAAGVHPDSGPFTWGMTSGPLVISTAGLNNVYDLWTADVFYTYETGANQWNQYAALVDAQGVYQTFDAPLQFQYTHTTADDLNGSSTYNSQSFFLGYGGPGNLWGIPSAEVDTDGDGQTDRWYPLFSIKNCVLMGPTGTEYVIKAMQTEQSLALDVGGCTGLDLSSVGSLPLPDISGFTPPDNGSPPVVNDPPRVIEGVLQGGG